MYLLGKKLSGNVQIDSTIAEKSIIEKCLTKTFSSKKISSKFFPEIGLVLQSACLYELKKR